MTNTTNHSDKLDQTLTRALEAVPSLAIADDFASRVLNGLPPRKPMPASLPAMPSIGRRVSFAMLLLLFLAMLALSIPAGSAGHSAFAAVEYVLAAEFVALTLWLSLRAQTSE